MPGTSASPAVTPSAEDAGAVDATEPVDRLLRDLRATVEGLSTREAQRRLVAYGETRSAGAVGLIPGESWRASSPIRSRCFSGSPPGWRGLRVLPSSVPPSWG